jgi:RHS repeat-associated protein
VQSTQTTNIVVVSPNLPVNAANSSVVYSYQIAQDSTAGAQSGYDGAGNIVAYTDSINGGWSSIGYDNLNRLNSATVTMPNAPPITLGWTYDSSGNRLTQTGDPYHTWATYDQNNQITATPVYPAAIPPSAGTSPTNGRYDPAGNMIDDGSYYYVYDAAGRLCATTNHAYSLTVTGYLYDANGNRIAKGTLTVPSGSSLACPTAFASAAFQVTTLYLSGPEGDPMAEFSAGIAWSRSYVNGETGMLASEDVSGIHLNMYDWLGTRRSQTDLVGTVEASFQDLPFGDGLKTLGADDASQHFTGKERDTESGLDYFGARYYSSAIGRFSSPDSVAGDPMNPQSWNLYNYVQNNPLKNIDPDGHDCIYADGNGGGTILRGDCKSDTDNGVYVDGHIDENSFKYNAANNSSSFSYTPDDAPKGTIGTGVLQGPNLTNGFEPGSLAAGVFGPANNATWNNAANAVNTVTAGYAAVYGGVACYIACPAAMAAVGRWGLQRLAMGASSPALLNLLNRLYQAQDELPGGTAGALRNEVSTGEYITYLGGHAEKAENTIRALQKLINSGELSGSDQMIAGHIISDLKNSLGK